MNTFQITRFLYFLEENNIVCDTTSVPQGWEKIRDT